MYISSKPQRYLHEKIKIFLYLFKSITLTLFSGHNVLIDEF